MGTSSFIQSSGRWLYRWRWPLCFFVAAAVVRLHWNLHVHPLGDYIYSDMNGYVQRADRLLQAPTVPHEYSAFFPFGTHWLLAASKWLFGADDYDAFGIFYALLGSATVALAYCAAARASRYPWVAPAVGALGVFYYPLFSLGGYILSETPFAFFLMAALVSALRLADHGRHRDAWLMGLCAGLGALFRPQMLLSAAAVGLFWLARRKALPNIRPIHLVQSAVPLVVLVALGSAHLHFNTGRVGLISENGSFNLVFGRCHNGKIESQPDGKGHGRVHFRPPPFLQIENRVQRESEAGLPHHVTLDPALGPVLGYRGYIGDRDQHKAYIRRCIAKTGWWGQIRYSWLNANLLWRHNIPWPDSGRSAWRSPARWWTFHHRNWLAVPALLALAFVFVPRRDTVKMGLVGVNLLALLILAAVFFGGTRHRAPYDLVIITLAFEAYSTAGHLLLIGWRRYRARAKSPRRGESSEQNSSSS